MSKKSSRKRLARIQEKIEALKAEIVALGYVARGSVVRRTKVCGKSGCRCAHDPAARHGPYFEWGRLEGERRVTTTITASYAQNLRQAIRNQRRVKQLLRRWERESERAMKAEIVLSAEKPGT